MNAASMFQTCRPLILASSSPRRRKLLDQFGIQFDVVAATVDETPVDNESPVNFVRRMAKNKAIDVGRSHPQKWIVGADTVVALDDRSIIGKPSSREDAFFILRRLSGKTHTVYTGLCIHGPDGSIADTRIVSTDVTFITASDELLQAYTATGEPLDKAGAYGIQGLGSFLIQKINGSCTNVIGLPISCLIGLLLQHEIIIPRSSDNSSPHA